MFYNTRIAEWNRTMSHSIGLGQILENGNFVTFLTHSYAARENKKSKNSQMTTLMKGNLRWL